jgi:hypothetical protein
MKNVANSVLKLTITYKYFLSVHPEGHLEVVGLHPVPILHQDQHSIFKCVSSFQEEKI